MGERVSMEEEHCKISAGQDTVYLMELIGLFSIVFREKDINKSQALA